MSKQPTEPERLSDEEIDDLARRVVTNEVFITNDGKVVDAAFMVILPFINLEQSFAENVGALYEEYAKTGSRSMNGYPVFYSVNFLHKDDLGPLYDKIEAKKEALVV